MDDFWPDFIALERRGFRFLEGNPCELEHYDVELRIHNGDHSIDVQGTARGRVIGAAGDQLRFLLGLNCVHPDQAACTIRELTFNGKPARYKSDRHMYQLLFGCELSRGDAFEIGFSYQSSPAARKCWVNSRSDWPIPGLGNGETEESILRTLADWLGTAPSVDFSLIQLKRTSFGPYAPFPFVLFTLDDIDKLADGNDWKRVTQMLAHEIGHFWFGNLVGSDPTEQWLSEGFAEYTRLLVTEHIYGREALNQELENYVRKLSEIGPAQQAPLCNIPLGHPAQFILVRCKGAIVLHCLRQECETAQFLAFLKQLVTTHRGKLIDTAAVEDLCRATGTLQDARQFFDMHLRGVASYGWNDDVHRIEVTA
jgi:hypothetical protein